MIWPFIWPKRPRRFSVLPPKPPPPPPCWPSPSRRRTASNSFTTASSCCFALAETLASRDLLLQHLHLRKGVLHHLGDVIRLGLQLMQIARGLEPVAAIGVGDRDLGIALHRHVNRLRIAAIRTQRRLVSPRQHERTIVAAAAETAAATAPADRRPVRPEPAAAGAAAARADPTSRC